MKTSTPSIFSIQLNLLKRKCLQNYWTKLYSLARRDEGKRWRRGGEQEVYVVVVSIVGGAYWIWSGRKVRRESDNGKYLPYALFFLNMAAGKIWWCMCVYAAEHGTYEIMGSIPWLRERVINETTIGLSIFGNCINWIMLAVSECSYVLSACFPGGRPPAGFS